MECGAIKLASIVNRNIFKFSTEGCRTKADCCKNSADKVEAKDVDLPRVLLSKASEEIKIELAAWRVVSPASRKWRQCD